MKDLLNIDKNILKNARSKYELIEPDGGWGYVIMIAVIFVFGFIIVPMSGFGIIYNQFLEENGDVTSGAAITNSIFNTALCFTGLAANQLLQKLSYRKVGLIGVILYFIGSFSIIFVNSLFQLIITFGILQGIGFGLMMPTVLSSFNSYFNVRRDVIMSTAQACLGIIGIFVPAAFQYLMDKYGFRGSVAIMCALSLHTLPAMVSLQPVKWHLKKRKISNYKIGNFEQEKAPIEEKPLLKSDQDQEIKLNNSEKLPIDTANMPEINKQEKESYWKMLIKALDLGLFRDPSYVNIICGIALSITSDLAFLPLYPTLLVGNGFTASEITVIMTTYFMADLIARVSISIIYAFIQVKNRHVFLFSALLSAVFRIAFTMHNSFWWITCISAILGFLRSPIQAVLPLVIAEAYGERFVTAFSLYMVVCGFIALGVGFLAASIKNYTNDDVMVVHLYSLAFLLCAIPWSIELIYIKLFKKKKYQNGIDC